MPNGNRNEKRARNNTVKKNTLGKPPRHPGAPKGPITPRNRKGRARNIQNYPQIQFKEPAVGELVKRFRTVEQLEARPKVSLNTLKTMPFGKKEPKTVLEIRQMTAPVFKKWIDTLTYEEQEALSDYL